MGSMAVLVGNVLSLDAQLKSLQDEVDAASAALAKAVNELRAITVDHNAYDDDDEEDENEDEEWMEAIGEVADAAERFTSAQEALTKFLARVDVTARAPTPERTRKTNLSIKKLFHPGPLP